MPILTQTSSANTAITLDLSNLATSTTFLGGRESTQIDNSTTNYVDCIVSVLGIVGHATTAPVVGQAINIYVWGSDRSIAVTAIDALDGLDSAETLTHAGVLNSLRLATNPLTVTVATAALTHYTSPFGIAQLFGGVMPKFWGLYVSHSHAGALGAANSGKFSFAGITYTST